MITKKNLLRFIDRLCAYCIMAMGLGMIAGSFALMFRVFYNIPGFFM